MEAGKKRWSISYFFYILFKTSIYPSGLLLSGSHDSYCNSRTIRTRFCDKLGLFVLFTLTGRLRSLGSMWNAVTKLDEAHGRRNFYLRGVELELNQQIGGGINYRNPQWQMIISEVRLKGEEKRREVENHRAVGPSLYVFIMSSLPYFFPLILCVFGIAKGIL